MSRETRGGGPVASLLGRLRCTCGVGLMAFRCPRRSPPRPIPNPVYRLGPGSPAPAPPVLPSSFLQGSVLISDLPQFLVTCPEVPASLVGRQRPL